MSSSKASDFAPRWVKCAACILALLILPTFLATLLMSATCHIVLDRAGLWWSVLPVTGILAYVFLNGLHCLIDGRSKPSLLNFAVDWMRGSFHATQDNRPRGRD